MTLFLPHSNVKVPEGIWHSLKPESDKAVLVIYERNVLSEQKGASSAAVVALGNLYAGHCVYSMPFLSAQDMGQAAKSARTIVISGVPDGVLNNDVMSDILVIHFQKAKNNGGDVEEVKYPTTEKGVAYITFEDQEGIPTTIP